MRSGRSSHAFWWVRSCHVREDVLKMIISHYPCTLCTFLGPLFCFLPRSFVQVGWVIPWEGAQGNTFGLGQVRSCEGGHIKNSKL